MNLSKLVTTTAAALALAAPVATAATKPVHGPAKHHKVTTTKVTAQSKVTTHVVYKAPWGTTPIITPRYIYIPGGTPDPNAVAASQDDCSVSGNNCTPEQLCDIWGQC